MQKFAELISQSTITLYQFDKEDYVQVKIIIEMEAFMDTEWNQVMDDLTKIKQGR